MTNKTTTSNAIDLHAVMSVAKAQSVTIEQLDAMTTEELQFVADVLAKSEAKKSRLKLDQINAVIAKRKKEAKKSGDAESVKELTVVENSVKNKIKRQPRKKADEVAEEPEVVADEPEELGEEEELHMQLLSIINESTTVKELKEFAKEHSVTVPKVIKIDALKKLLKEEIGIDYLEEAEEEKAPEKAPEKPKTNKGKAETDSPDLAVIAKQMQLMQKQLEELKKENATLKNDMFPETVPTASKTSHLVKFQFSEFGEIQSELVASPYKVYAQIHEGLDTNVTTFLVLFMNEEKLVLLDKSREVNTVLDLTVESMKDNHVTIDNRKCPIQFYKLETIEK